MNEREQFEELLNSKLSERDFSFDELSWDDIEHLIVHQEKRRKKVLFAFVFFAGLVAGMLFMLPFLISNDFTSE